MSDLLKLKKKHPNKTIRVLLNVSFIVSRFDCVPSTRSTLFNFEKFKLVVLFLTYFVSSVHADSVSFDSLDVKDGLPDNAVRAIAQENSGIVWFGTELGLASWDGLQIRRYLADDTDENSIAGSYVRAIELDSSNTLWVSGSDNGLSRYNRDTDDFENFQHTPGNLNSISSNTVTKIRKGAGDILWIATDKAIDKLNTNSQSVKSYPLFYNSQNDEWLSSSESDIRALYVAKNKTVWAGGKNGILFYNSSKDQFELLPLRSGKQPTILSIAERNDDNLWIGTREGLFIYSRATQKVTKFSFPKNVERVHSLLFDSEYLWVGSSKFGIFRIDDKNNIVNIRPDKTFKNSLGDSVIFDLHLDHSGMIWIATYNAGVFLLNPNSLAFGSYNESLNSLECLVSADVRRALAIDDKNLLLGTPYGLILVDLLTKNCRTFQHRPDDISSLSHNGIYALSKISENEFLVGTTNGLNKFNFIKGTFTRINHQEVTEGRLGVYSLMQDKEKIFLATNKGVYLFFPKTSKFQEVKTNEGLPINSHIFDIIKDTSSNIWFTSTKGLFKLNPNSTYAIPQDPIYEQLTGSEIWGIVEKTKNIIWLAIEEKGLFEFNTELKTITSINDLLGIDIKNGFAGLYSTENSIWISTYNRGLIRVNKSTTQASFFDSSDGLHSDLFNAKSHAKFPDGRLLFGGKTGFNIFNPKSIKENKNAPIISLTQLRRFGKPVIPHKDYDGLKIDKHISEVNSLSLTHRDTIFGFDFIATDYLQPEKITYSYLLEGFDQNWTETSSQNRGVTYNNVDPGDYTFRVKAKNSRGIWSKENVALEISIAPAPWFTWWAYTIYALISIFLIWFTFNKRTQWLKERAIDLESTVELRTKELATEKEKVEQLLSRKNEEFANVSHEFRTPLTLILGPINQLVTKSKDKTLVSKLNIVQRNALRLLRMVDQLLNLETFRVKAITQKSPQAIGKITQLVAEAFADLAEEKQITFNIETIEPVCFDFTPDAFEKIILNLLSNAIKYTKPGGTITVSTTRIEQALYQIQVSDTGIGIAKDKLENVFERFNRVMDENSEQVTGSGIGLALVKSLVESHEGSVELESELGQGTTITVKLPIINEVDESQINVHQNDEIIAMELMNVSSSGLHEGSIAQSAETIQSTGKPTVLVIEDNDDMRQYIVESIGQQFNTLMAADGQAGLELAIREVPDLIISDIMMPKLDGYQTTKALREAQITNHIPVVLLTARGDRDSRLKGWEEKADEYITKPFDVEELVIRISNLIEIRNILKRRFSETVFEKTKETLESPEEDSGDLSIVEINTQRLQQEFIEQLNQHIESVYMEAELAVVDIAKAINMSERQFYRKLRSVIDMTPSEYLRRFRLEKSKEILRSGKTANFTAFEVGFSSQAYFSKCFKAQYNLTPRQFVNQK